MLIPFSLEEVRHQGCSIVEEGKSHPGSWTEPAESRFISYKCVEIEIASTEPLCEDMHVEWKMQSLIPGWCEEVFEGTILEVLDKSEPSVATGRMRYSLKVDGVYTYIGYTPAQSQQGRG